MTRTDALKYLVSIGERLRAQDNLATADPLFTVEKQERVYHVPEEEADGHVWLGSDGEEVFLEEGDSGEGLTRVPFRNDWRFVTAFFTSDACDRFVEQHKGRSTKYRTYVDSAHNNYHWRSMREALMALAPKDPLEQTKEKSA